MQKNMIPNGWFYMSKEEMPPEKLAHALKDTGFDIEVWKEAGVLEIGVAEKTSLDLELMDLDMGDEFSNEFVAKNGIHTIYYLTITKDRYEICKKAMQKLVKTAGGMICADSEDFLPIMK